MNESIVSTDVRKQMMNLWKNVFGDSDEYISLIFDSYYNIDLVGYYSISNKVVSSLLSIEYILASNRAKKETVINNKLVSRYLCGLATDKNLRGAGIMTKLINNAVMKAYNDNIAFIFLIPSNDGLIKYYRDRCFVSLSYNRTEFYYPGYNFLSGDECINCKYHYKIVNLSNLLLKYKDSYSIVLDKYISDICCFINNGTDDNNIASIYRSAYDMDVIIRENIISDGCICLAYNEDDKICGVIFSQRSESIEVNVQMLLYSNIKVKKLLLSELQQYFGKDRRIAVAISSEVKDEDKLFSPYNVIDSQGHDSLKIMSREEVFSSQLSERTFAMARIIKVREVLIFAASQYPGRKYSILITQDFLPGNCGFYEVAQGHCVFTPLEDISEERLKYLIDECQRKLDFYHLSVPELASLLWRKKDDYIVDDTIEIPRLPIEVSLLLE